MSMVFEEAEDDKIYSRAETATAERDREVTLNSATVLGIFFGLVLICGLFFGLGYAMGRRSSPEAAAEGAAGAKTLESKLESPRSEYRAKPSASGQGEVASPKAVAEPAGGGAEAYDARQVSGSHAKADEEAIVAPSVRAATLTGAPVAAKGTVPEDAPAPVAGTFMVQIAAVSNPADAEVLLGALTKRGYTVVIRHEAKDALLHVQIGPFSSKAEAVGMRQKLLGDGYNAILK